MRCFIRARALFQSRAWSSRPCCRCSSEFGVIVEGLELRSCATTRVPQRKNLHFFTADPVVKVVVNSSKMDAPYTFCLGIQRGNPDTRLRTEERKRLGELFV